MRRRAARTASAATRETGKAEQQAHEDVGGMVQTSVDPGEPDDDGDDPGQERAPGTSQLLRVQHATISAMPTNSTVAAAV